MLQYDEIKEKPREFLAATGLTDEELQVLLPTFEKSYELSLPRKPKKTRKEKTTCARRRQKVKIRNFKR